MISEDSRKEDPQLKDEFRRGPGSRSKEPTPVPVFHNWRLVPDHLKSRAKWLRKGRKVKVQEPERGYVVCPRLLEDDEDVKHKIIVNENYKENNEPILVSDYRVPLYELSQTQTYTPTARTRACWDFADIFLTHASRDEWILATTDGWSTIKYQRNKFYPAGLLTHDTITGHLNHTKTVGIKNKTGWTRFVVLDLDLHGRNRDVFLKMAEILLNKFRGETWHSMIKQGDISGIHLIRVFPRSVELKNTVLKLREQLAQLDQEHPELAEEARKAGMPSFAGIEIYPTNAKCPVENKKNGVRLPLAMGRIMVLDKYLMPQKTAKGTKARVEEYVRWLKDPNRKSMSVEKVMQTLSMFSFEQQSKPRSHNHSKSKNNSGWKNNTRERLTDFWLDGISNNTTLNTHIAILARASYFYGHNFYQTTSRIKELVRQLPKGCGSQRILKGDFRKIDAVIDVSVDHAYTNNRSQNNPDASSRKWQRVAEKWQSIGFDPLWPSRIDSKATTKKAGVYWPKAVKRRVIASLGPLFKNADKKVIVRFAEELIQLVVSKGTTPWGQAFFKTWVNDKFPGLHLGNNSKRNLVLKLFMSLGVLARIKKGSKGRGSSIWCLGETGKILIGENTVSGLASEHTLGKDRATSSPSQLSFAGRGPEIQIYGPDTHHSLSLLTSISLCPIFLGDDQRLTQKPAFLDSS